MANATSAWSTDPVEPKVLELAVYFFGSKRVLFGSDARSDVQDGRVFTSRRLRSVEALGVPPRIRAVILANNAKRILKIG
jgi:predicted TIM-barrel fold metal-dependent hydrolase